MVRLEEVAPIERRPVATRPDLDYPIISARSFGRGTFHQPTLKGNEITWEKLFRVRAGDLLVSNIKAWEGAVAIVRNEDDGMFCSHRYITCGANPDRIYPEWLAAFFKTGPGVNQLASASPGSADRNRTLSMDGLRKVLVPLPPLHEQKVIVSSLNAAERCVSERAKQASTIQAECDALLQNEFARSIESAPPLPLGRVAPLVRRVVLIKADKAYTEIGVRSFFKGTFHRRTLSGSDFTWQKLFEIRKGDLIFSNLMAWERGIALAESDDAKCVGNHRMLTCEVDRDLAIPEFLWFYFTTEAGFAQVLAASPGSIARNKTLSAEDLPRITVPLPSLDLQERFCTILRKVNDVRAAQAEAAREADQLVPALLQEVFGTPQLGPVV